MNLEVASITQHSKSLRLPSVGAQFASLAEEASQQNHSHLRYLEALLQSEVEDREHRTIELRLKDAHLPRMTTLEEFDFAQSPHIPASRIRALAEGGYLERAEPVLLPANLGRGKVILQLASPSRRAGRGSECASPRLRPWSTCWSKRSANRASAVCCHAGREWS